MREEAGEAAQGAQDGCGEAAQGAQGPDEPAHGEEATTAS